MTPVATLIETLASHSPPLACELAEKVQDIAQENIQRACATAYYSLTPHEPYKTITWAAQQVKAIPMVRDVVASIVVLALNTTSDEEVCNLAFQIIPSLAAASNECGNKMTWACVRLAQHGYATEAWQALTQFMEQLNTRGTFGVRDAIDAIATEGGYQVLPLISNSMQQASPKLQISIIQGLAKSPYRRILHDIYAQKDLALPENVRDMLKNLIIKHDIPTSLFSSNRSQNLDI